jgi:DnaJ-class molecular chaperone
MALVEGEYEFKCSECNGEGSLQVIQEDEETGEPYLGWDRCDECRGEGTVCVDDEEAAEWIEVGHTPLRSPAGS